jgi:hypothetical protein
MGAGYAMDYTCTLEGKKIMGYIEWPSEIKPVPKWCPIRLGTGLERAIKKAKEEKWEL